MGLYDRDYLRDEPRGFTLGSDMSVTNTLILVNVAIYIIDVFADSRISQALALQADLFTHPWDFWQLLSYGFVHDSRGVMHILFNMFTLWMFGNDVEAIYGRRNYLLLYLSLIVLSGLSWLVIVNLTSDTVDQARIIGASGGIIGILMIYIMHFPTRVFMIWGVVPVPVWILGTLMAIGNIAGALNPDDDSNVAYTAHLAGAAWGYLFYRTGWHLGRIIPNRWSLSALRPRPKLKIHEQDPEDVEEQLNSTVDQILEKISREGEASLTAAERKTLERASRRYQQKRR